MHLVNQFLDQVNQTHPVGMEMVFKFFVTFSRFEFALKSSIVFAKSNKYNSAEPDWKKFINTINGSFDKNKHEVLLNAVTSILNNPPRVQRFASNNLIWESQVFYKNESEIEKLGQHIRDIRNNLFHGAKFEDSFQPEISRNYDLLHNALVVLDEWLQLEDRVRSCFLTPFHEEH